VGEEETERPSWESKALYLLLAICGYLIGDLLTTLKTELQSVRSIVESHSALIPKVPDLETRHDRLEERVRDLERETWRRNGPS
jgi:hypothetical protein